MGLQIAETMTEIFQGFPPGHSLFEQFSFIGAEELSEFEAILRRHARGEGDLKREDRTRLLALPLAYIEARHRLGLLDSELDGPIVEARGLVREVLAKSGSEGVEFLDPERSVPPPPCGTTSCSDASAIRSPTPAFGSRRRFRRWCGNSTFWRISSVSASIIRSARRAGSCRRRNGRCVNLVRCLVKRPDILVVDGALAPFDEARSQQLLELLLELFEQQSLFMVLPNNRQAGAFDVQLRFRERTDRHGKDGRSGFQGLARPEADAAQKVTGEVA